LYFCDFYASFYEFLKLGQISGFERIQKSIKNPEWPMGRFQPAVWPPLGHTAC
jgi:hypothetical protein